MRPLLFFFILVIALTISPVGAQDSVIVADATTGRVLVQKDADKKRPVASLTKIVSAMVVLDWAQVTGTDLATQIQLQPSTVAIGGPNPMQLRAGDTISLRDALYSALLGSDNIATQAMAEFVGFALARQRQTKAPPVIEFVKEMNALAEAVGAQNTQFYRPHGLEGGGKIGLSTAADMAILTMRAMSSDAFAFYVSQKEREISVTRGGQELKFTVQNTNKLLGQNNIIGVKTGLTTRAGQCLATFQRRKPLIKKLGENNQIAKRQLVCIVLNSQDRFAQTRSLLEQGKSIFDQWAAAGFPSGTAGERYLPIPKV